MADQPPSNQQPQKNEATVRVPRRREWSFGRLFTLRKEAPLWQQVLCGVLCIVCCLAAWWYVTRGEADERILPAHKGLPSPEETLASFPSLWVEQELTRETFASLKRVALGFGLAALVGIPLGVLCGCFTRVHAFFNPLAL